MKMVFATMLVVSVFFGCDEKIVAPKQNPAIYSVKATLLSENSVFLTWLNTTAKNDFIIARGSTKFGWTEIATTSTTSYVDSLKTIVLANCKRVSYLVYYWDDTGRLEIGISNEITIR